MHILFPRIVITPCWGIPKWLGYKYSVHLLYGVEYYNSNTRWAEEDTCSWKRCRTKEEALAHAARIKSRTTGCECTEWYDWGEAE